MNHKTAKIKTFVTRQLTFQDHLLEQARRNPRWGEPRSNAGRKAGTNPPIHHVRRGKVPSGAPGHVILRVRKGIPSLRKGRFLRAWRQSLRRASEREGFRVVHYSVQRSHAHFIVEAPGGKYAMECGMKAVGQRFARCVNRVFGRNGPVLYGRYNLILLETPRQVRNALAYVLLNVRKHGREAGRGLPPAQIDPCSSGPWFDGWKRGSKRPAPTREPPEVAPARFWLLTQGWRRYPLVSLSEVPGGRP